MDSDELNTTDEATLVINVMLSIARDSDHSEAQIPHLASALFFMDDSFGFTIVEKANSMVSCVRGKQKIDGFDIKDSIDGIIQRIACENPPPLKSSISPELLNLITSSAKNTDETEASRKISTNDLMLILYEHDGLRDLLEMKHYLTKSVVSEILNEITTMENLKKYTIDMLKAAKEGKIEKVVGRHNEIRELVKKLTQFTVENVCLVAEPHVDVIAVIEGLALRIASGVIPDDINTNLLALNIDALVEDADSSAVVKERFTQTMNEMKKLKGKLLIFIDELQFVLADGKNVEGLDAGDVLKPLLEQKDIKMVGAIFPEDYEEFIEKDPSWRKLFQKVIVNELTTENIFEDSDFGNDSVSTWGEATDFFDGGQNFGITSALVNSSQMSDRYLTTNFNTSKRKLLRTQQTVSERFQIKAVNENAAVTQADLMENPGKITGRIKRPENILTLERKVEELEKELETLQSKDNKDKELIKEVLTELTNTKKQLDPILKKWQAQHANELKRAQKNLDSLQMKASTSEKAGDFEKAADLKFGAIPALKTRIQELIKVFGE